MRTRAARARSKRARLQTTVVEQGYGHVAFGLPSLLVGGAAVSTAQYGEGQWDTIGACGEAPEDHAVRYVLVAIVLLLVAWLAVPTTIWLVIG